MLEMLTVIGPMFLVIVAYFGSGFIRRFRQAGPHLNAFVFFFALPTFVYTAMVTAPPVDEYPVMAMVIPLVVTPVLSVLVYVLARWMTRSRVPAGAAPDAMAAPTSLSATFGNVGYFGIPISIGVLGPEAGLVAGIVHTLHNILYMNGYPLVRTTANTLRASGESWAASASCGPKWSGRSSNVPCC
ncbi:AEC family transporter [Nesterenkonia pannonica]|uniref:AEC family transporter n=1 Tax=Nesterenkonia pannonica TaxID=1548602 RepID=UPI0021646388|nr:AEC family transporter [Nesterenkonia pannonica]